MAKCNHLVPVGETCRQCPIETDGNNSDFIARLDALVTLWQNRWRNCHLRAEQLSKRGKYYEAAECKIQANAFMDAAKELKDRMGN